MDHNHREAFCLMKYKDTDGNVEYIWNSRDGVTPFGVVSFHGKGAMHVEWNHDEYLPDYDPPIGSRIFVDMTREQLREILKARVERDWEHPESSLQASFVTKEDAIEGLTTSGWREGAPIVMTVDEGLLEFVRKQRAQRKEKS